MMGYYPWMGYGWGGFGLLGLIFPLIFWTLVIFLLVGLFRSRRGWHNWPEENGGDSAIRILKERYAKGEIDKKEYEEKKKDLS